MTFTESVVEQAALAWLDSVGRSAARGLEIAPCEFGAERTGGGSVVSALVEGSPGRFQAASRRKIES